MFLSPLGVLLQLIVLYKIPITYLQAVFTPELWNWQVVLVTLVTPLVGLCVWSVKKWAYYILLGFAGLSLLNNVILYASGAGFKNLLINAAFNAALIAIVLIFVRKEVSAPYFNPNMRWWEQARRYETHNIRIEARKPDSRQLLFEALSFDISEHGAYVLCSQQVKNDEIFDLEMHSQQSQTIGLKAKIVWAHTDKDGYPEGFGCRFIFDKPNTKQQIRTLIKQVKEKVSKHS